MTTRKITDSTISMDTYLQLVELTEPPLLYHRWCFISIVSAAIGRNLWIQFGDERIYSNQFVTLIGPPGARKSTAINIAANILLDSGYEFFSGDRSSKEKFLQDWEHGFDNIAKGIEPGAQNQEIEDNVSMLLASNGLNSDSIAEVYIKAGELEDFLGAGNTNFVTMLTNLWDNPPKYTDRFKNSKSVYIPNPTINLLGGATTATFASIFNSNIIGKGMLSRMILVHGRGQRMRLTIPPPLPTALRGDIVQLLHGIRTKLRGPVSLKGDAYDTVDAIYHGFNELADARLASYSSRRLTHLLKLCLVIAATQAEMDITVDTVLLANSILSYTELYMPKALGEFGKSRNSELNQIVLDAIGSANKGNGVTMKKLVKRVGQDVDSVHELAMIVLKLKEAGKVDSKVVPGKSPEFFIVRSKVQQSDQYVDYSLLYEYKFKEAE